MVLLAARRLLVAGNMDRETDSYPRGGELAWAYARICHD